MIIHTLAAKFETKFEAWRRYRNSVRELEQLSDRELTDLGIVRGNIAEVARQALTA